MEIILSILAIGVLIVFHEAGHLLVARLSGMEVIRFSIGFGRPLVSMQMKKSRTVYQLGWMPFGGYVQIKGMNPFEKLSPDDTAEYQNRPLLQRMAVTIGGSSANLLIGWLMIWVLLSVGRPVPSDEPVVGQVVPDGPAAEAGITAGDRIKQIGSVETSSWNSLVQHIHMHPEQSLDFKILKADGSVREVSIKPEKQGTLGMIGIMPSTKTVRTNPANAFIDAGAETGMIIYGMLSGLVSLASGERDGVQIVGPVRIIQTAAGSLKGGIRSFLDLMAVISIVLFLFNLLPLPALDGGKLFFLVLEAVLRRRPDPRIEAYIHTVGFIIIISLIALVSIRELDLI